jgi:anti-anti-sigma factor
MEFTLKQIKKGEVQILSLNGYMGNDEFYQVDQLLSRLLEQKHGRVILDLTKLSFTTSVSLARFLVCGREFRRHGGELKLVGLSPEVSRLARMAGFSEKKDCEPDVAKALKAMAQMPKAKARPSPKKQ